ncbi:acyltransferase family protein [Salipiger sp. 1_MG-2023]|uniref:acyltransferase family protein n=1 Tax=Salipiger sp. 1_MG-2023 TaxID=3062665 RepID=UPI0026E2DBD3|nr:acyltransferase family protein [Salipiger sp. 1_MG-2023]MDO6588450.1 acyltransferase family protein [Salipiger sp. 1_MG-2023]
MQHAMIPDVSVLIATRNRAAAALRCLRSVRAASAQSPDIAVEIIVVENDLGNRLNPVERILRDEFADAANVTFVAEDLPGLARARNVAIAHGKGRILVFIDDDCLMDAQYFNDLRKNLGTSPGAWDGTVPVLFGGRVDLADPADQPFTIRLLDSPETYTVTRHPGGFVQGCNLVMTRATLDKIGGFDRRFGAGARFRASDDTDIIVRAHRVGIPIQCFPDMRVAHAHGRRTREDIVRLASSYAYGDGALYARHAGAPWLLRHFYWTCRGAVFELFGGRKFAPSLDLSHWKVLRNNLAGASSYLTQSREAVPPPPQSSYRPQLDSIRAVALLMVLLQHFWLVDTAIGHAGVRIFFVLSGFLITRQLLAKPPLVEFYLRRASRLAPAFVLGVLLAIWLGFDGASQFWKWHLLQLTNLVIARAGDWGIVWPLGHFWTLNIEAQFYLIWPFFILALPSRALVPFICLSILAGPAYRAGLAMVNMEEPWRVLPFGEIDALAMGALLAVVRVPLLYRAGLFLSPVCAVMAFPEVFAEHRILRHLGIFLSIVPFAALIAAGQNGRLSIGEAILPAIGKISYGAYVYHWVLYAVLNRDLGATPGPVTFVVASVGTLIAAWISFHAFETPVRRGILRLAQRSRHPQTFA